MLQRLPLFLLVVLVPYCSSRSLWIGSGNYGVFRYNIKENSTLGPNHVTFVPKLETAALAFDQDTWYFLDGDAGEPNGIFRLTWPVPPAKNASWWSPTGTTWSGGLSISKGYIYFQVQIGATGMRRIKLDSNPPAIDNWGLPVINYAEFGPNIFDISKDGNTFYTYKAWDPVQPNQQVWAVPLNTANNTKYKTLNTFSNADQTINAIAAGHQGVYIWRAGKTPSIPTDIVLLNAQSGIIEKSWPAPPLVNKACNSALGSGFTGWYVDDAHDTVWITFGCLNGNVGGVWKITMSSNSWESVIPPDGAYSIYVTEK
eukprot:TRINITY_DN26621_c0_g1_i1.p1 TRINITY_DN26621_c0_g1~~TRINITY_DN26621_c0_g1_i1.p1  ORF type:complete len:314 (+),score=19.06 TRINITY_DN26621_c0_g1_i1:41-982(+)